MSHELFGERAYSLRQAMWHNLGTVSDEPHTAVEIFEMMGPYEVEIFDTPNPTTWEGLVIPTRQIVRHPTTDDPQAVWFGTVGPEYTLVKPRELAELWDAALPTTPVETMGALKQGRTMFITTKLPTLDIRGDVVENYLMVVNPLNGLNAAEIRVSPVRVVCQNTLIASAQAATAMYRLVHDGNIRTRTAEWLATIMQEAAIRTKTLTETFNILAGATARDADVTQVLEAVYAPPKRPQVNAPDAVMKPRIDKWNAWVRVYNARREAVMGLYQGGGTGMDHPSARGTWWGAYNAITEAENYRKGGRNDENAAYEVLFGERAATMARAYDLCLMGATGNLPSKKGGAKKGAK